MGLVEHCLLYVAFLFFFKKKVWRFPFQSYSAGYLDVSVIVYSESFNWTLCLPLFCRTSRFSATLWTVVFPFCNGNETFLVSKKKLNSAWLIRQYHSVPVPWWRISAYYMVNNFCIHIALFYYHLPYYMTEFLQHLNGEASFIQVHHSDVQSNVNHARKTNFDQDLWAGHQTHTDGSRKASMWVSHVKINILFLY